VNKAQLQKEKELVIEMSSRVDDLTDVERKELLRLKCRTDFKIYAQMITREVTTSGTFTPYSVHNLICNYIQNVCDGEKDYRRTTVSLAPRSGKSLLISKLMPSWQLGRSPSAQFIMASYALKLTHENSRAIMNFVTSDLFKWIFPECVIDPRDCNLKTIRSKQGGIIMSASAGAGVTGFGFGVISEEDLPGIGILDDLLEDGNSLQVLESTFKWTATQFLTRGLPNNCVMSIGTRFHKEDVIGRLLASDPEGWLELNVPALCLDEENDPLGRKLGESHWPEFFPVEALESLRRQDEQTFNTLYLGRPQGESGAIFKDHWFSQHYRNSKSYEFIFATADTALKKGEMNDNSVICIFGVVRKTRVLHLIHVYHQKMEFPELLKAMPAWMKLWKVRALYIESRSSGLPLIQMLRRELNIAVKEVIPVKDKIYRANEVAPVAEDGRVSIYNSIPDLGERMAELCAFPYTKKDDFVDAFCMGLKVFKDEIMGSAKTTHGGTRVNLPQLNHTGGSQRLTSRLSRGSLSTTYLR
jgi:predicted phage terminase large subunit-like protein